MFYDIKFCLSALIFFTKYVNFNKVTRIYAPYIGGGDITMAKSNDSEKTMGNPNASSEEKTKALEAARLQIEKQFGAGSLIKLGAHNAAAGIEVVPSGSILLDEALGIGGYPRGRIIEIYGPESSGKTTLALHVIAEAQKLGGNAAFVEIGRASCRERV